jgi:hypothetical protein
VLGKKLQRVLAVHVRKLRRRTVDKTQPHMPRFGLSCPSPSWKAARALVWFARVAQISEAVHDLPRVPGPKVQRCESVEPDLHTFRHERATGTSADICHFISIDRPWSVQPRKPEDSPEHKGERRVASQGTLKAPTDQSQEPEICGVATQIATRPLSSGLHEGVRKCQPLTQGCPWRPV